MPLASAPETKYAQTSDGTVAYQVFGDGPHRVLWIPDWHNPIEILWEEPRFQRFCTELARFSRVILFDKRGTGISDPIPTSAMTIAPTLELAAEDAGAVLDAEKWKQCCVVGVGCGCWVAALFAASAPARVSRLVLVDAVPGLQASAEFPIGPTREDAQRFIQWIISVHGTGRALRASDPAAERDPEFRRWYGRLQRFAMPHKWMQAFWTSVGELHIGSTLSSITAPTLVMNHAQSAIWPPARGRAMTERIPSAEFRELPGGDELFFMSHPSPLLAELHEFLTGERTAPIIDRVLATILFTDIADSTDVLAAVGDRPWRDRLARHNDLVRSAFRRFRGREIDSAGDGFLSSFDGPARAVHCAAAIRDGVRELDLEIRAAIHVGECELLDDKISGIAVHTAARVLRAAQPGEILVTRTVRELTAGSGLEFADRGAHALKGIPEPSQLFALVDPATRRFAS
jgi:class 3 adenylate cyclase